ncbi:hypothetical protein C7445_10533 [Alicyclobacillus sacchari]|uniref:DUF4878 domain-containing protein n=1 Tax=Alicyclobacillus sacchari TaxID=392010 RepID=A0A4R8LNK3_9BACL|nr:hypothetical protein [Alicyclobacillus sacchari]TDY47858.1 hypothetical protein C7445_10533 [Alicyclobacillus sacchari]GMA55946.1 hypothetical protein GCM10025858_04490 [Alicyclobacillus sacchari]
MNTQAQRRRQQAKTRGFITLVVALLILGFGSYFLLRPTIDNQTSNTPVNTVRRFIGFVELKEFTQARNLMTPTFQNTPGWHASLYNLYVSLDPAETSYALTGQQGDIAQVQFSSEQGGVLYLKKINGRWLIMSPNEVDQSLGSGASPSASSSAQ